MRKGEELRKFLGLIAAVVSGMFGVLASAQEGVPKYVTDEQGNVVYELVAPTPPPPPPPPPPNDPPVANAGPDQTVEVGTTVQLDGSGSADPEGEPLSYAWTTDGPPLNDSTSVQPTFTAEAEGVVTLQLVVNDGVYSSAPDTISVTVVAAPPPPPPPPPPPGIGFGSVTKGGDGLPGVPPDTYVVTTLDDSGPGSLRAGILGRLGPRIIKSAVGGTITLLTELKIREPYLTIDFSDAPAPGITVAIKQTGPPPHPMHTIVATHDIILRGYRWAGTWVPGNTPPVSTATLAVDGDGAPQSVPWDPNPDICWPQQPGYGRRSCRIWIDRVTTAGSRDAGPDFWCGINDLTFSNSMVIDSFHPRGTGCKGTYGPNHPHSRHNITEYGGVYAYNGDRNPKLNEGVYDYDFAYNIVAFWQDYGTLNATGPSGNGPLFDDDGAVEDVNYIGNTHLPGGEFPPVGYTGPTQAQLCAQTPDVCSGSNRCREKRDCIFGDTCKYDAEELLLADALHFESNVFAPKHNRQECVSTQTGQQPIPRPYTLPALTPEQVLAGAGMPFPNAREQQIKAEIAAALAALP